MPVVTLGAKIGIAQGIKCRIILEILQQSSFFFGAGSQRIHLYIRTPCDILNV
jgi:hypothetical protein